MRSRNGRDSRPVKPKGPHRTSEVPRLRPKLESPFPTRDLPNMHSLSTAQLRLVRGIPAPLRMLSRWLAFSSSRPDHGAEITFPSHCLVELRRGGAAAGRQDVAPLVHAFPAAAATKEWDMNQTELWGTDVSSSRIIVVKNRKRSPKKVEVSLYPPSLT